MTSLACLLAELPAYRYSHPFIQPLFEAWDYWYLFMLPLCLGVSIVYKSIRCHSMRTVAREAAVNFFWIVAGISLAAVVLVGITYFI